MFGAKTAVVNYDIVSLVKSLAMSVCTIPKDLVHSQVDDVPTIGRKNSSWCEEFTIEYEKVCKDLDIELAPECPLREKAFKNVSSGKVLGIIFNSEDLSWRLPEDKRIDYMNLVHKTLSDNSLLGKLAFVCTMCQKLRTFKKPLQNYLSSMIEWKMCPYHRR